MRWRLRALLLGLMAGGLGWIYLSNYLRLGRTPADYPLPVTLVNLGGSLLIGLLLDALAGYHLKSFFHTLGRLQAGERLAPGEAEAVVGRAIRFPERSALFLVGISAFLVTLHRMVQYRGRLIALWLADSTRTNLLSSVARDMLLALLLALLLFTLSRRILRPALVAFGLRALPEERRFPIGLRLAIVVLATGVFTISLFLSTAETIPPHRVIWIYLPPVLLTTLVGYLVATDVGRDLETIAERLRALASGARPALYSRFAVTDRDEVGELVSAINRLQDRSEQEFARIERDLEAARHIQMGLLPRTPSLPPGWQLTATLHPAQEVGGDFYDLIDLGDGRYGLALGDAVGKGLPAALLMASTVSLIRSHAPLHQRPGAVLEAVNRLLCASLPPMAFVTAIYAIIDTVRGEAALASAGHFPPIIGGEELPVVPALPLGIEPDLRLAEQVVKLPPGRPLLLYSDGLIEPERDAGGERLEWMRTALRESGGRMVDLMQRLMAPLQAELDQGSLPDDVTLLVLIPPAELQVDLPSRPGAELAAAEIAGRFAREHGPAERADAVATAVGEACLNAICHGNRWEPELSVRLRLTAGPSWIEAVVGDDGPLFALPESPPDLAAQMAGDGPINGWGIHLIRAMADEVQVEPVGQGKQVRIRFGGGCPV